MEKKRPWITFFSQTGTEIVDLTQKLGVDPDILVTNERPETLRKINPRILESYKLVTVPNKPTVGDYEQVLGYYENPIVTLHGWLRVVPEEICTKYTMFNGHPGLITKYPELKGKDPQVRAYEGNYELIGAVLHKVSPGVDEGKIIAEEYVGGGLSLDETFHILRDRSLYMWHNFLEKVL